MGHVEILEFIRRAGLTQMFMKKEPSTEKTEDDFSKSAEITLNIATKCPGTADDAPYLNSKTKRWTMWYESGP